jgi:hypothetical protein
VKNQILKAPGKGSNSFSLFAEVLSTSVYCCGSGSALILPFWLAGPGSRKAKITYKNRKNEEISCSVELDAVV